MEAFSAGKIDAVTITNGDALVTGASGRPSTAIVLTDYSNGNDMIIGKPGIGSIKDLKGKKIGLELNLVEHLLLLKALEMNGMKESDIEIVNFPTNETPQALASDGVDAIGAWYPVSGQALKQVAGSKPLFTSGDAPGLIYDALYVGRDSLASRPDDWKKVVGVWFKTVEFIQNPSTRDEAVKIMAARVNVPPEEYAKSMDGTFLLGLEGNLKHYKDGDGLESLLGSGKAADAFNAKNKVYEKPQDVKSYIDDRFVKEASASAKK
jgi:NitT/TauT family transport system substrate-binding protein